MPDEVWSVWRKALRTDLSEILSDLLPGILRNLLPGAITTALANAGIGGAYLPLGAKLKAYDKRLFEGKKQCAY